MGRVAVNLQIPQDKNSMWSAVVGRSEYKLLVTYEQNRDFRCARCGRIADRQFVEVLEIWDKNTEEILDSDDKAGCAIDEAVSFLNHDILCGYNCTDSKSA